jgi:Skp family chaperone for outer membrane proteins
MQCGLCSFGKIGLGLVVLAGAAVGGALVAPLLTGTNAVAQAGSGSVAPVRIATVDVLSLVERMVTSERYASSRQTNVNAQAKMLEDERNKLGPVANEAQAAMQKAVAESQGLKDGDPKLEELKKTFQDAQNKMQGLQQQEGELQRKAQDSVESFNTQQVGEVYALVMAAAQELATKNGYSHVIASRNGPVSIRSNNVPGAVQEILARPVVVGIAGDDLTERVADALKIGPAVGDAGGAAGGVPPVVQGQPMELPATTPAATPAGGKGEEKK